MDVENPGTQVSLFFVTASKQSRNTGISSVLSNISLPGAIASINNYPGQHSEEGSWNIGNLGLGANKNTLLTTFI